MNGPQFGEDWIGGGWGGEVESSVRVSWLFMPSSPCTVILLVAVVGDGWNSLIETPKVGEITSFPGVNGHKRVGL